MGYVERPLDNPINWSFRVGRLFDIDIRVHVLFVLCAIVMISLELGPSDVAAIQPFSTTLVNALGTYGLLFLVVLLHEFGHCFGARYTGGEADEILLWPLGGLASTNPPHEPRAHLITTAAGPAVNVIICLCCAMLLTVWTGTVWAVPWNPLHPTLPADPIVLLNVGTAELWIIRLFGISYVLLLFNLLPVYPFDGGRILQALLWARKDYVSSLEIATATGMVGSVLVALFGVFTDEAGLLLMIAVFGYVTCWQMRRGLRDQVVTGGHDLGYDFSRGYAAFDGGSRPRRPGFFQRRRARRAAIREERERQREIERQQAVEEVLRKVSQGGMGSLSPGERRVLEEETQRRRAMSHEPFDT